MANKVYMVIQNGVSKKTGNPYSRLACKVKFNDGEFLSDRDVIFEPKIMPVGTFVEVEQTLSEIER